MPMAYKTTTVSTPHKLFEQGHRFGIAGDRGCEEILCRHRPAEAAVFIFT